MQLKKTFIVPLAMALALSACKKNDSSDADPSDVAKEVSFTYNGLPVTYGVIKKVYTTGADGKALSKPVTKYWLDRNLGAQQAAQYPNDSLARGDLFQWGRPADGHQNRYSPTDTTKASTITPGHENFIIAPLGDDWLKTRNDSLWNTEANTNCSCPTGWRVPTEDELKMELLSWKSDNIIDSFNSELKWVPSGNRDNHGTLRYSTYWAFVWSSTPVNNMARELAIVGGKRSELISSPRISGGAVRCIKK